MNKEREIAKFITVLDFEVGKVFQYGWPGITDKHQTASERCEEYLSEVGHNLNNGQWMVHNGNTMIVDGIPHLPTQSLFTN